MNRILIASTALCALAWLGFVGFQTPAPPKDPPKPAPAPAPAQKPEEKPEFGRLKDLNEPLRISCIPDADKEKSTKKFTVLTQWISKDLGRPVAFVAVEDQAAALTGLASNKIDIVWLGGVGAVQAEEQTKGRCQPIIAREEDLQSKSYFIANKKLVDSGKFTAVAERKSMPLESLAAMKPKFAELTMTFGDKLSSSGHLMPRYFLERPEVGIDPEKAFKQKPAFTLTGGPAGVLAAVAKGSFDLGVLNDITWEKASDEERAAAPVIFVTPTYADSCFVIHTHCGPVIPLRVMKSLMALDPKVEEQKAVLDTFGTAKFVPVSQNSADLLRTVVKSAKERHLLE